MSSPLRLGIQVRQVIVLSFAERSGFIPYDPEAELDVTYDSNVAFFFDEDALELSVRVGARAFVKSSSGQPTSDDEELEEQPALEADALCVFGIIDLDHARNEADEVKLPRPFVAHLAGMSLSALRGILVGRATHPLFSRAPLPTAAPITFIDDLVERGEYEWVSDERALPDES